MNINLEYINLHLYNLLIFWILISLLITTALLTLSFTIGFFFFDKGEDELNTTYECGFMPIKDTRINFTITYYSIAILFIIFDFEIVFIFPWALIYNYIGYLGFFNILYFFGILTVGLIYEINSEILKIKPE